MTHSQTADAAAMDDARPILKPGWSAFNIFLMVLGFIIFWPLGLAMMAYNIWGHKMGSFKKDMKRQFGAMNSWGSSCSTHKSSYRVTPTGNRAFDEYREKEFARLEEERQKIEAMRQEFDDYMEKLRKARDQEEFDRFMSSRTAPEAPSKPDNGVIDA